MKACITLTGETRNSFTDNRFGCKVARQTLGIVHTLNEILFVVLEHYCRHVPRRAGSGKPPSLLGSLRRLRRDCA